MKAPELPSNEDERLRALELYQILDTPPDEAFDLITQLAASVLGVPIALISIVDTQRQWFKSRFGLDARETPRDVSFCGHVVASGEPLVVRDAFADERFADNPLVTGAPHVRFYAGAPLRVSGGVDLGTLCVIDHAPRDITAAQMQQLTLLARQAVLLLDAAGRVRAADEAQFARTALEESPGAIGYWDATFTCRFSNRTYRKVVGAGGASIVGRSVRELAPPEVLRAILPHMSAALRGEQQSVVRAVPASPDGRLVYMRLEYVPHRVDGRVVGFFAFVEDVTAQTRGERQLSEILDHMVQGVMVFGRDGVVAEIHSRSAQRLFGDATAGRDIRDLLFDERRGWSATSQLFDVWIAAAFDSALPEWAEIAKAAPSEVVLGRLEDTTGLRTIDLEFRPMFEGGKVVRILLLATDVSEERRRAAELRAEQVRHGEGVAAMRRIIAGSGGAFVEFLHASDRRVGELRELAKGAELPPEKLAHLLETVRTLRAEARAFHLQALADECELLELTIAPLHDSPLLQGESDVWRWSIRKPEVSSLVSKAAAAIDAARALFIAASPTGRVALDQTTVRTSDLEWLVRIVDGRDDEIEAAVRALSARPFGECCASVEAHAGYWSEQLGKPVTLTVAGRDVAIPSPLAEVLRSALPHLVRNCIAHGIESPAERSARAKPPLGRVELSAEPTGRNGGVRVCVWDDGRGVDEKRPVAKAESVGLGGESVAELPLSLGLPTAEAETERAGLGRSLSAVRDELRAVGYDVRAERRERDGTTFVIAPL